jgi:hypothetical protein
MIRTTARLTTVLGLCVAAPALTAAREAPAQQVLASSDSAQPASITVGTAAKPSLNAAGERTASGARNLNVWSGNVRGDVTGQATVMLLRLGPPDNALDPIWPVTMRWTVESLQDGRSFVAELFGSIDSRNDCMHLGGIITEGWKKGAEVQVDCLSKRKGGKVALRILPLRGER